MDEIDLHMHPQWQRDIVDFLLMTFPATQFIVTAHSPLIVQASADANIILLKRQGDHVVVNNNPEIVAEWRIDQLLTSDLFGLKSARKPDVEAKIVRRKELLLKDELTPAEETELQALNESMDRLPLYDSPYERKAQAALDRIIEHLQPKGDSK
ncbi:MAG: AAA family ATPase [Bacteroidia bacterium]